MKIRDIVKRVKDNKDKKYTILLFDEEDSDGLIGAVCYTHRFLEEFIDEEYTEEEMDRDNEDLLDITFADKLTGILQGEDE